MRKLSVIEIDRLNIALMVLSVIPALLLPFSTFLFVYAFLGPLHYLTEINWLHKKQYFTQNHYEYSFIYIIIGVIGVLIFTRTFLKPYVPVLTFIAFFSALGFVSLKNSRQKAIFTALFSIIGLLLFFGINKYFKMVFSILMPTIVHVFIFTALFIILGALKSKSPTGMASVMVFAVCAAITLSVGTGYNMEVVSQTLHDNHRSFRSLNTVLMALFGMFGNSATDAPGIAANSGFSAADLSIYFSETGIRVMRFIAFAYTYHYLNWFSKTSVIQWHNTKKINLVLIFTIWIASVILYVFDYKTGLKWLFILSFGHVLLEFPLNHRSFIEIKQRLTTKLSTPS